MATQPELCFGDGGGHIRDRELRTYPIPVPGHPGTTLSITETEHGQPCTDTVYLMTTPHGTTEIHVSSVILTDSQSGPLQIGYGRDRITFLRNPTREPLIPFGSVTRLVRAWQAAMQGPTPIVQRRGGQEPKVTAETAPQHAHHIRRIANKYRRAHRGTMPSQRGLVKEYGAELGYNSKSGFEDHLAQLAEHGFYWQDLKKGLV